MTESDFGFFFERAGRSAAQGAIAPAEQYFEGSRAEVSVVRETGQNSVDADDGVGPVRMEFEVQEMPTSGLPGIVQLREHLALVVDATRGTEGHDRMNDALALAHQQTIPVLRISDYGTTGLEGSESLRADVSRLSALTRGAGISANDGRGGSFGIGSAVGPMASDLCTVYYASMPRGGSDVVFTGHSRLATHADRDGILRVGDGFYTDRTVENDFRYLRNPGAFGSFEPRGEPGTDIFIIGYRKAGDDPKLHTIRDAFIDNFMMAIDRGRLQASGKGAGEHWHLDAETLEEMVRERPESRAFYRAIQDPEPVVMNSERFGELRLYINVDPSLPKKLHTITMRSPLMKIDTFRHNSVQTKYAAVLECAEPKGNLLLRRLEPPQHDSWDGGRALGGKAALAELKSFVGQAVKERVKDRVGDIVEIKGLARFLPSGSFSVGDGSEGRPGIDEGASNESASVQGDPGSSTTPTRRSDKRVPLTVQQPAKERGGKPTTRGKDPGGTGTRRRGRRALPGGGEGGDGGSRIASGQFGFRSWSAPSTVAGRTMLHITLSARGTVTGDIELVTLGAGGAPEPGYELPILSAQMVVDRTYRDVQWEGNVFRHVELSEGQTTRLEIELTAGRRYRLDVK